MMKVPGMKYMLAIVAVVAIFLFMSKERFNSGAFLRGHMASGRAWMKQLSGKSEKNTQPKKDSVTLPIAEETYGNQVEHYEDFEVRTDAVDPMESEPEENHFELDIHTISPYTDKTMSIEKTFQLERPELSTPEMFYEEEWLAKYADPSQVVGNDAGSGDISELTNAFKNASKDQFYKNLEHLSNRGGNAVTNDYMP